MVAGKKGYWENAPSQPFKANPQIETRMLLNLLISL